MLYQADHQWSVQTSLHGGVKNNFSPVCIFFYKGVEGGVWRVGSGRWGEWGVEGGEGEGGEISLYISTAEENNKFLEY